MLVAGAARLRLPAPGGAGRSSAATAVRGRAARARPRSSRRVLRARVDRRAAGTRAATRGDRQIGAGAIFGEPQPWAILAGAPDAAQAATAGREHPPLPRRRRRAARSCTARRGSARRSRPARNDPGRDRALVAARRRRRQQRQLRRRRVVRRQRLAHVGARRARRRRPRRAPTTRGASTRATRSRPTRRAFPDHWAGTISVDDTCYALLRRASPAQLRHRRSTGTYDGQITEQPTWMVMDAIRLAGITPTRRGYRIAPHLPFGRFSLRLPQVGVAARVRPAARLRASRRVGPDRAARAGAPDVVPRVPRGLGWPSSGGLPAGLGVGGVPPAGPDRFGSRLGRHLAPPFVTLPRGGGLHPPSPVVRRVGETAADTVESRPKPPGSPEETHR